MRSTRANIILYPFLFGIYPVLALIAHNASEMDFTSGLRALAAALILTTILYAGLLLLVHNPHKSALLASFASLLFYSYGHINLLAREWVVFGITLGRHRVLLPIYLVIFILGCWLIIQTRRDLQGGQSFLNAFALILLLMPVYQITASQLEQYQARQARLHLAAAPSQVSLPEDQVPPDVYYILLDGYPRGDFINQHLGSNNSAFLESLEEKGFFVAHCSQSNYSDTRFSLASTLNMEYLDAGQGISEVVHSGYTLDSMIRSGEVQANFADLGYTIITFESGYKWLRWELSDHHLSPEKARTTQLAGLGLNDFEHLLLDTTAAKFILDLPLLLESDRMAGLVDILENPRAAHRERVMFSLDQLPRIPGSFSSPKFVYAHIIFPHPPFIVDAGGNLLQNSPPDELQAYADQITYLDQRLLTIIDQIIQGSPVPPVIILQGDHGATIAYEGQGIDPALRLGILNAYYLPPAGAGAGQPDSRLYPGITPVNSFRLLFDAYFNGQYGLLPDLSIIGHQSPYTQLDCNPPR